MNRSKIIPRLLFIALWLPSSWLWAEQSAPQVPAAAESAQPEHAVAATDPGQVVDRLHSALLELSALTELSVAERAARLEPVVRDTHNLTFIARLMLRRDWEQLSEEQRTQFLDRFARLSVMDYAGRFRDMQQGEFAVQTVDASRGNRARVEAELSTRKRTVSFVYTLDHGEQGWQIVSIVVDGVSEMALRRNEYSETLAKQGFAALLALIDQQIAERE